MGNIVSVQCGDALTGRCWDCIARKSLYVSRLEHNLDALQVARDQLMEKESDVRRDVINQQRPQMEQPNQVTGWLSRVDGTISDVNDLLESGAQERQKLCMAGCCSKNCKSSYKLGKSVARSLIQVNTLMAEADRLRQVVVEAPAKLLESNLLLLTDATEDLKALKEDLLHKISLEEGPERQRLNQVQAWLSRAETLVAEADQLMKDGPQDFKIGRVAQILEDIVSLHSKGNFSQFTEEVGPRRVVEQNLWPTVGTKELLEEAWSHLHNDEVGIIGIYGMGGVGKTTLLTQINNKFAKIHNDFDVVIWVGVSKDLKLDNIQESIWKQIRSLNEDWKMKSSREKAQDIFYELRGKKFVLLLDDVWQQFDLGKIGIPLPTQQNGSKIVLTTRSSEVCGKMKAKQIMKVESLNPEEAWQLFMENVGKIDADILPVARQVARECCGLPIALITIGSAMASRSTLEQWESDLEVLRRSPSNLQGMEDVLYKDMEDSVFELLKFSYDRLPNDKLQSCFLYCSLFPEDFKILKDDLVHYWLCENFCGPREGYGILYTLIRQCLLEEEGECVKLHDVIRDMAEWIACKCEKEKHKFFTQAGAKLIQLPEVEKWEGAKKVSFMANSFTSIKGSPECGDLETLFLSHMKLNTISRGFFHSMTRLTVLDLSYTELSVLPLEIGELKLLEYLNLSHTKLEKLPIEMNNLKMLRYLNLEHIVRLRMIPVDVISKFSKLQVLNMFKCGTINNAFSLDGKKLEELMGLQNLFELSMTVRSVSFLNSICSNQKLLKCMRALYFHSVPDTKSINISSLANVKQFKILEMFWLPYLEEVIVEERETHTLCNSPNNNLFVGLREVNISTTWLRHMTWLVFASHLTILRAKGNGNMEEIISAQKLSEHQDRDQHFIFFEKLQVLDLQNLQKLKTICPLALPFPSLTQIIVSECPALKKLPLNSESAEGCNVVIKAEKFWWNELTWEDDVTQAAFSSCYQNFDRGFF